MINSGTAQRITGGERGKFFRDKNEDGIKTSGFKKAITIPKKPKSIFLIGLCNLTFPYRRHAEQNCSECPGYLDSDWETFLIEEVSKQKA
ncbi:MAG: hypothetical protein C4291_11640 [Candidatus Dadabacteria bacterium]